MLVYPKCYYETINTPTVITVVIKHVYKSLGHKHLSKLLHILLLMGYGKTQEKMYYRF